MARIWGDRGLVVHHEVAVDQSSRDAEGGLAAFEPLDRPRERTVGDADRGSSEFVVDDLVGDEDLLGVGLRHAVSGDAEDRVTGAQKVRRTGADERRVVYRRNAVLGWPAGLSRVAEVGRRHRQGQSLVPRGHRQPLRRCLTLAPGRLVGRRGRRRRSVARGPGDFGTAGEACEARGDEEPPSRHWCHSFEATAARRLTVERVCERGTHVEGRLRSARPLPAHRVSSSHPLVLHRTRGDGRRSLPVAGPRSLAITMGRSVGVLPSA